MDKIIAVNRRAKFEYYILETYEAGLVLKGTEVKSIRDGKVSINESFGRVGKEEVFIYNMHIAPYEQGNRFNVDPLRTRKLLLHKQEIKKLTGKMTQRGLTLIPLKLYFKNGVAKLELCLAKGKKMHDKRETIKKRDMERELRRKF